MTGKRLLIHGLFVLALPLVVAGFGISLPGAAALVLVALLWRWGVTLSGIMAPAKRPDLELESIGVSHFVEKVRWCMDWLGVDYSERQMVGVLGVLFTGRSVPKLSFRTGLVRSSIGNSPEILRYLWGAYAVSLGERARFLEPTAERLELENKLDRYGVDLQIWAYYHLLDHRELTLQAWGCDSPVLPAWQRMTARLLFPLMRAFLRRAFSISERGYAKATEHIENTLCEIEVLLADGRRSLLGGDDVNFSDITFAALSSVWLQPPEFGGEGSKAIHVDADRASPAMRADLERWTVSYPRATDFVRRLYRDQRAR